MALKPFIYQAVSGSGSVVSGAKAYVWDAGTSTLSTVYLSATQVASTNPQIALSNGIIVLWLDDANTYDIQVKTADDATTLLNLEDYRPDGSGVISNQAAIIATLAAAKALTGAAYPIIYVEGRYADGDGYEGFFRWDATDCSTDVSADDANGLVFAPSGADGSDGAWRRIMSDGRVNVLWFGAVRAATAASTVFATLGECQAVYPHATALTNYLDWLATQAAVNAYPGREIYLPGVMGEFYRWDAGLEIHSDGTAVVGDGEALTTVWTSMEAGTIFDFSPADPEATEYIDRPRLIGLRVQNLVSENTVKAVNARQCAAGYFHDLNIFGFAYGIDLQGGIACFYSKVDARIRDGDVLPADAYVLRVRSADRGSNGFQHAFSHEFTGTYFSGLGSDFTTVWIQTADGLQFVNGYWKGSDGSTLRLEPEDTQISGLRLYCANIYLDGAEARTIYGVHVPATDWGGNDVTNVNMTNCLIGNNGAGNNVKIENPTNGVLGVLSFTACNFASCADESFDVANSGQTLDLTVNGGELRNSNGGLKITSANSVTIDGLTIKEVTDGTGSACIDLNGTITQVSVTGVKVRRPAVNPAATFANNATIDNVRLHLDNNATNESSGTINGEVALTPTLLINGSSGGISQSTTQGVMRVSGPWVIGYANVVLQTKGVGTGDVTISLTGMPAGYRPSATCPVTVWVDVLASGVNQQVQGRIAGNTSVVQLSKITSGSGVLLTDADITNTTDIRLSFVYRRPPT